MSKIGTKPNSVCQNNSQKDLFANPISRQDPLQIAELVSILIESTKLDLKVQYDLLNVNTKFRK